MALGEPALLLLRRTLVGRVVARAARWVVVCLGDGGRKLRLEFGLFYVDLLDIGHVGIGRVGFQVGRLQIEPLARVEEPRRNTAAVG